MKINGLLQPEDIIPSLASETKDQILLELAVKAEERLQRGVESGPARKLALAEGELAVLLESGGY